MFFKLLNFNILMCLAKPNPKVKITDGSKIEKANELHEEANNMCFIANSCNFKIQHKPNTIAK